MSSLSNQFSTAVLAGVAMFGIALSGNAQGEDSPIVQRLQQENKTLQENLVAVSKREEESRKQLTEIQLRLEAMGDGLLDGGSDRLVKAVSDLEVMSRKLKALEDASLALAETTRSYLATAVAASPEARVEVETKLRDLDTIVGIRESQQRRRVTSSLQQAKIVSVDSESGAGVVVVNVGEDSSAVVGMPFEVYRNDNKIGEAQIAFTRDDVSTMLITNLENDANTVRRGDRVLLKSN